MGEAFLEGNSAIKINIKNGQTLDSAIPLLRLSVQKFLHRHMKMGPHGHSQQCYNSEKLKQPKYSSFRKMLKLLCANSMESVQKNLVYQYVLTERSLKCMVENSKLWSNTCSMMPFLLKIKTIQLNIYLTWSITYTGIGYLWGAELDWGYLKKHFHCL